MTIKIKNVTAKNFLSIGNVTQSLDITQNDVTLILGENLDLGGSETGSRNGVGKTVLLNAISYGLYGSAITSIKKDNLINRTNQKNMLVTIDFEKDGTEYRIERGRKPNVMKFFVGGKEQDVTDDAQGDNRETQAQIEKILMLSHDMFRHIVALNTYNEPFLSLKANDQRVIIEQLLGITILSEKAVLLKEQIKLTKESITKEEFRISAVSDANKRIEDQIESLKKRQRLWLKKHNDDIDSLSSELTELQKIDIDQEIANHRLIATYNQKSKELADLKSKLTRAKSDLTKEDKLITKLTSDVTLLEQKKCHACGQAVHDDHYVTTLESKASELESSLSRQSEFSALIETLNAQIESIGDIGKCPEIHYETEAEAYDHRGFMAGIQTQLAAKQNEKDPYAEQIEEMISKGLEEISYDHINDLTTLMDHQEFLLKLLTNKDSFIRKKIIDQNLSYLNSRLSHYLDKTGLPHTVVFNNDLSVSITELGRDMDFHNLSRGEMNRLIISLSLAFRDVWESLYQPINVLFVDELIDFGMDASGVESCFSILKHLSRDRDKNVLLISHRDELVSRVSKTLRVYKESGFTTYQLSDD